MNLLRDIFIDLRDKRLWPLALVLILAIAAIPLVLSKSSNSGLSASAPPPSVPALPGLPVVSAQSTISQSHPTGPSRNPFAGGASTATTTTAATTSTAASTASSATSAPSGGSSVKGTTVAAPGGSSGAAVPAPISTSTLPTSIIVPGIPKPTTAPAALTSTQSYDVALAETTSSGGLNTIDPLVRLSVLPNDQRPLLVELGVLKGGHRVLFAVQPGAVVGGPGVCTPGPIDCEILSLAPEQTESLSQQTSSGVNQVALFAVTGVTAVDHHSVASAQKVRRQESLNGRAVLNSSPLSALSLFRYDPAQGVMLDLRNLQVGES